VVTLALADLEKAWEPVHSFRFPLERSETNPQFAELVNPDEVIISVKFEVEMDEPIGLITFCIPYSTLEPVRKLLETPYHRKEQESKSEWAEAAEKHLQHTLVEMAVEVGRTQIPARQLLELNPGDVLVLDKDYTEPLVVKVENVPKFDAFAGLWKGKKAFKVNRYVTNDSSLSTVARENTR
jgi:flagellar motor switch protein FliM